MATMVARAASKVRSGVSLSLAHRHPHRHHRLAYSIASATLFFLLSSSSSVTSGAAFSFRRTTIRSAATCSTRRARCPIRMSSSSASSSCPPSSSSSRARNIVVVGGGIQGTSIAYQLYKKSSALPPDSTITILESKSLASAASGKGGGFMARSWGDGSPTQSLHHLAFDMYRDLAEELHVASYRKLPVLSVAPSQRKLSPSGVSKTARPFLPGWLDGNAGTVSPLGMGDDTAQITPHEFVHKMVQRMQNEGERSESDEPSEYAQVKVILGTCTGVETTVTKEKEEGGTTTRPCKKVTGVKYVPRKNHHDTSKQQQQREEREIIVPADTIVVSAGPWSCKAEDWFDQVVELPMEGIKSTSIVWKNPNASSSEGKRNQVDATALFCGEDYRFGTHLEVYPRPDGTIYICGIGGSDYVPKDELKGGAFREECNANVQRVEAATKSFHEMSETYKKIGQLETVQACMRPCPPDALPYMGAIPGYEGAYINAGHNCWGIAWAPAYGKAISELILDGHSTSIDLSPFDPARFTPKDSVRGGRGRKRRGASVGEQW